MERKIHTIDAKGFVLGRLAAEIAKLLQGKHKPSYKPNIDGGDFVEVKNVDQLKFTGNKLNKKIYYRHSGYPGGLKSVPLKKLFFERPEWVLKKAVLGMLPKNRLRAQRIQRLTASKSLTKTN